MYFLTKKRRERSRLFDSLSLFGKLPGFNEFIKVNAGTSHASMVNEKIDEMVNSLQENHRDLLNTLNMNCVFEEAGNGRMIQMIDSHDSSGRAYPFIATGLMKYGHMHEYQPAAPILWLPLLAIMVEMRHEKSSLSKEDIDNAWKEAKSMLMPESKALILEMEIKTLKSYRQGDWLNEVFPEKSNESVASFITMSTRLIQSYKRGATPHLNLPLSRSRVIESALFWLQWIDTLLKPKHWPLNVCIVHSKLGAHMQVWFKKPEEYDFARWVIEQPVVNDEGDYPPGLIAFMDEPDITLCDMIYCWKHEMTGGNYAKSISS